VRLLLDTHALLWFYLGDLQLSAVAQAAIADPGNGKFVSPASYWELAIKINLGKYVLAETYDEFIEHAIFDNGFAILPVEPKHTAALIVLPRHHKDPFDRLLVAQAQIEGIPLVSGDAILDQYPISRLW
jgi:PIN domain nuclease of toxin-antitoxin system